MALLSNNLYRDNKYKLDCEKKIDYFEQNNPNNTTGVGLETSDIISTLIKTTDDIGSVYVKEDTNYHSTTKISEYYHKLIK